MSKDDYSIFLTTKQQIVPLMDFHYLSKEAITFRSGFNVGLFCQNKLVGGLYFYGLSCSRTCKRVLWFGT